MHDINLGFIWSISQGKLLWSGIEADDTLIKTKLDKFSQIIISAINLDDEEG